MNDIAHSDNPIATAGDDRAFTILEVAFQIAISLNVMEQIL